MNVTQIHNSTQRAQKSVTGFLKLLILIVSVLLVLPSYFWSSPGYGLDASWKIALHLAFEEHWMFGKDFVFTYGPLGFLSTRLPFESTHALIVLHDCFLAILCLYVFSRLALSIQGILDTILFLAACLILGSAPLLEQDLPVFLFLLYLFIVIDVLKGNVSVFNVVTLLLLSCDIFLLKHSMGLGALLTYLAVALFTFIFYKRRTLSILALLLLPGFLFLVSLFFPVSYWEYLYSGFELSKGYNESMMLFEEERTPLFHTALVIILLYASLCLHALIKHRKDYAEVLCMGIISGFLFLLYKQSFVRADGHAFSFYIYVPISLFLFSRFLKRYVRVHALLLGLIASGTSLYLLPFSPDTDYLSNKIRGFQSYLTEAQHLPDIHKEQMRKVSDDDPLLEIVKNASVDIIPWDVSYLYYADKNYQPRPVHQSYASYTPYLDKLNQVFYQSENAPQYVIYAAHCADYRYCFWDDTNLKYALLQNYRFIDATTHSMLLEKDKNRLELKLHELSREEAAFNSWIKIPSSKDSFIYAEIKVSYSIIGKLRSIFFQSPMIELVLKGPGFKKQGPFRAVKPIMEGGVLVNKLIMTASDAKHFFQNQPEELMDVKRIRLIVKNPGLFQDKIDIRFYELKVSSN